MHSTVCRCVCVCVGVRLYIFVLSWKPGSRGYCGALGWSRVNSSLTPIHYGPLLPPSRCSALRHSQPPSFTHNVNHSGQTHRHRGGPRASEPPGVKYYLCVCLFFKCECVCTCSGAARYSGPPDSSALATIEGGQSVGANTGGSGKTMDGRPAKKLNRVQQDKIVAAVITLQSYRILSVSITNRCAVFSVGYAFNRIYL